VTLFIYLLSNQERKAAIHIAASYGKDGVKTLRQLLQPENVNVNIENDKGMTCLLFDV